MAGKKLIVTLTDDGQKKFAAVAKLVQQSGITVTKKMPGVGIIVGEVTAAAAEKTTRALNAIPGVAAVEEEGSAEAI